MAIVCCNYEISKSLLTSCSVLTLGDDRKCCKHNRMLVIPINCRFIHFNKFKIQTKKNNKNRNFSLRNILKNIAINYFRNIQLSSVEKCYILPPSKKTGVFAEKTTYLLGVLGLTHFQLCTCSLI